MTTTKTHFENIIIGGGIVGAGIFRDLSLHGQEVLLVDKNDFSAKTSQSSSKMLHGGIRYLENFDFKLVHEALHEKIYWTKLLPHLTKEVPFVLPIYKQSKHPLFMLRIGLFLYDFLSGFNNSPHKILDKKGVMERIKNINSKDLVGGGLYHDAIMDDAKITLEVIYDALLSGKATAWNYHALTKVEKKNGSYNLELINTRTNKTLQLTCKNLIFSLGPYTDQVLCQLFPNNWQPVLLPSKGSHLWIKKDRLKLNHPLVINHQDGRVIFFIPNGKKVLVGTTEVEATNDANNDLISTEELQYLLQVTNEYFPAAKIDKTDILSSFSGVRPLIKDDRSKNSNKGKTARTHKTYQIGKNIFVIAGGKYTTFRVMGQEITKNILDQKQMSYSSLKSLAPLRVSSIVKDPKNWQPNEEDILKIIDQEMAKTAEDIIYRRIGIHSESEWNLIYPNYPYSKVLEIIHRLQSP